jgi:uncharacterized protein DUF6458
MGIGTGIFLIALGAILKWGVSDAINGVNLSAIGVILMIVGVIGLVISLLYANIWSRRRTAPVADDGPVVREREYRSY